MRCAAVVLAAGLSRRMGERNKLLMRYRGEPLAVHCLRTLDAAGVSDCVVVLGHQAGTVREALAGFGVRFVLNPDYEQGMAGSIGAGIGALGASVDGALICLADMPALRAATIERLIAAFDEAGGDHPCVPLHARRRGNPVLWPRRAFTALAALEGDRGAKRLLGQPRCSPGITPVKLRIVCSAR